MSSWLQRDVKIQVRLTRLISLANPYSKASSAAVSTPLAPPPPIAIVFAALTAACISCNSFAVSSCPFKEVFQGPGEADREPVAIIKMS